MTRTFSAATGANRCVRHEFCNTDSSRVRCARRECPESAKGSSAPRFFIATRFSRGRLHRSYSPRTREVVTSLSHAFIPAVMENFFATLFFYDEIDREYRRTGEGRGSRRREAKGVASNGRRVKNNLLSMKNTGGLTRATVDIRRIDRFRERRWAGGGKRARGKDGAKFVYMSPIPRAGFIFSLRAKIRELEVLSSEVRRRWGRRRRERKRRRKRYERACRRWFSVK